MDKPQFAAPDRMPPAEWKEKRMKELEEEIQAIESASHPEMTRDAEEIEKLRKLKQELAGLTADAGPK